MLHSGHTSDADRWREPTSGASVERPREWTAPLSTQSSTPDPERGASVHITNGASFEPHRRVETVAVSRPSLFLVTALIRTARSPRPPRDALPVPSASQRSHEAPAADTDERDSPLRGSACPGSAVRRLPSPNKSYVAIQNRTPRGHRVVAENCPLRPFGSISFHKLPKLTQYLYRNRHKCRMEPR